MRAMRSIPTPVADVLVSRGCPAAGTLLERPELLPQALRQLHAAGPDAEDRAAAMLGSCRKEVADAWGAASSALELLQRAQARPPIRLGGGLGRLLGNALRPGGSILELCGLPGTGKTQLCLQLCASAQLPPDGAGGEEPQLGEAVYIDTEGSFVASRYAQVCEALLSDAARPVAPNPKGAPPLLSGMLRKMHVCRTYDVAEMFATLKHLDKFLKGRPSVRALVVDSLAFCFRHELMENPAHRARVLIDIATTLRQYGKDHNLLVVVTNHMTTRFDRGVGASELGWLAPALGETWAHQPSTQVRLERTQHGASPCQPVGQATLTKSVEQAAGLSCFFRITASGLCDMEGI